MFTLKTSSGSRICPKKSQQAGAYSAVHFGLFAFFILLSLCVLIFFGAFGTRTNESDKPRFSAPLPLKSETSKEQPAQKRRPSEAEFQSVKIQPLGYKWEFLGATDGDLILITCPINNPTELKLVDMTFLVTFWDASGKSIGTVSKKQLNDKGMDFVPAMAVKQCELLIPLEAIRPSSIARVGVVIRGFLCSPMTDLDTRLYKTWEILNGFSRSEREEMTAEEKAAQAEMIKLLKEKR